MCSCGATCLPIDFCFIKIYYKAYIIIIEMLFTFTKVVILIPFHCQVYSIKCKIKFVNDLWKVGEFIQILRFPPAPIKLTAVTILFLFPNTQLNSNLHNITFILYHIQNGIFCFIHPDSDLSVCTKLDISVCIRTIQY
jgi:hypothetical protein